MQLRAQCAQVITTRTEYHAPDAEIPHVPGKNLVYRVMHGGGESLAASKKPLLPCGVEKSSLAAAHHPALRQLTDELYYGPYRRAMGEGFAALGQQRLSQLLRKSVDGCVYTKGSKLVGVLLVLPVYSHPAFDTPTLHVGFWGYARKHLSRHEARHIKQDWAHLLHSKAGTGPISLQVGTFCASSLRLAKSFGFRPHALRVETLVEVEVEAHAS